MVPGEILEPVYKEAVKAEVSIAVYNDAEKELIAANGVTRYIDADARACVLLSGRQTILSKS